MAGLFIQGILRLKSKCSPTGFSPLGTREKSASTFILVVGQNLLLVSIGLKSPSLPADSWGHSQVRVGVNSSDVRLHTHSQAFFAT